MLAYLSLWTSYGLGKWFFKGRSKVLDGTRINFGGWRALDNCHSKLVIYVTPFSLWILSFLLIEPLIRLCYDFFCARWYSTAYTLFLFFQFYLFIFLRYSLKWHQSVGQTNLFKYFMCRILEILINFVFSTQEWS